MLDDLYAARAALGGKAARVRLAVFARERFSAELEERAAAENVMLVNAARLFE